MRNLFKGTLLGLFTGLIGVLLSATSIGHGFETNVGLSWLFNLRGTVSPPAEVAVVGIDSRTGSYLDLPESPSDWPRSIHATLIDQLRAMGADVIVFDIFFGKDKDPHHDQQLSDAIKRAGNVVLVEKLTGKRRPLTDSKGVYTGSIWVEELVPPNSRIATSAKGIAPFPLPKLDAAVYEFWTFKDSISDAPSMPAMALQVKMLPAQEALMSLLKDYNLTGSESLPKSLSEIKDHEDLLANVRAVRRIFKNHPMQAAEIHLALNHANSTRFSEVTLKQLKILFSLYAGHPNHYLNFYGPPGSIPTIPYHAVIKGGDPNTPQSDLDFTGKVVFVGHSDLFDPGQPDRFYTVFTRDDGVDLSGVEIAATAFANLFTNNTLKIPSLTTNSLLLFGLGLTLGILVYSLPAIISVPTVLVVIAGYGFYTSVVFQDQGVWLPFATPLLVQFPFALFVGLLAQYLFERKRSQYVTEAINYYLPENVAKELTENRLAPEAANRVVYSVCLATDMAGFSTIAETLSPDELAHFLNEYFEVLSAPLKRYKVDVTEFRADAIMCAWTSDKPNASIHTKAIYASLEAVKAIELFKQQFPDFQASLRIGLECGSVYVGHAGGGGHFVYSIVGDCANTASRIESLNKQLGTQLLATTAITDGLEELLLLRPLGKFQFVGKTEGLGITEILSTRASATNEQVQLVEQFANALQAFHSQQWTIAQGLFESILEWAPSDGPSNYYRDLCLTHQLESSDLDDPTLIILDKK